jgi:limonene-1,2-epoxide hydrolase
MTTQAKPTATATNADATIAEREQRVIEFFTSWSESFEAFCDSFALLTEDCVWDQRPIPRLIGPQQAVRFLKLARATLGLVTIDVEILHIASAGQIVHVQRVDRLRRADGSLIGAAPVAGVLEFHGERVIAWREYFDLAEFLIQAPATSCLYVARRSAQTARTTAMAAVRRRGSTSSGFPTAAPADDQ